MYAVLSAMNTDTSLWIVHTEYHPQVHLHIIIYHNPSIHTTTAQPCATILQTGTEAVDLNPNPTTEDITAKVAINSSEHVLGHTRDNRRPHRSSSHQQHSNTSTHCSHHDTPHQGSCSHRSSSAYS